MLISIGVEKVSQLRDLDLTLTRRVLSVVGERTVLELRGVQCLALEHVAPQRKGCAVTRSFGRPGTSLAGILEAVLAYATRACEKLRCHCLEASHLSVFMDTSEFNPRDPRYSGSTTVHLPEASNDTLDLIRAAQRGAQAIYRDGYRYAKAGIVMDDLIRAGTPPAAAV